MDNLDEHPTFQRRRPRSDDDFVARAEAQQQKARMDNELRRYRGRLGWRLAGRVVVGILIAVGLVTVVLGAVSLGHDLVFLHRARVSYDASHK